MGNTLFLFVLIISMSAIVYGFKKKDKLSKYMGIGMIALVVLSNVIDNLNF